MSKEGSAPVIVGIDPGTTCGLAIIGLDGHPISVESRRSVSRSQIVERIYGIGSPLLVASDVIPAPSLVRKIASNLDAVLFVPERDIPAAEKEAIWREVVGDHEIGSKDFHARDALAAAIKAYHAYRNKLAKVDQKINQENLHGAGNLVKKLVVKGNSIARAIALTKRQNSPAQTRSQTRKEENPTTTKLLPKKILFDQPAKIKRLEASNVSLRKQLAEVLAKLTAAQETLSKREKELDEQVHRERTYQQQRTIIEKLQRELWHLKSLAKNQEAHNELIHALRRDGEADGLIALRVLEEFTSESTEATVKSGIIRNGECILLANAGGGGAQAAENLSRVSPRAIICGTGMSHTAQDYFREKGIPVIHESKLKILSSGEVKYLKKSDLERLTKEFAELRKREYQEELNITIREDA